MRINVFSYNLQSILYQLFQPCAKLQKARGNHKHTFLSHKCDIGPNLQDTNLICSSALKLHMHQKRHSALRLHMASWKPCYTFSNELPVSSPLIGHCFDSLSHLVRLRTTLCVQTPPLEGCGPQGHESQTEAIWKMCPLIAWSWITISSIDLLTCV